MRFFLKKDLFFREGKGERRRCRKTSMCDCLSCASYWGRGLQPRHVLYTGNRTSTPLICRPTLNHSATPTREQNVSEKWVLVLISLLFFILVYLGVRQFVNSQLFLLLAAVLFTLILSWRNCSKWAAGWVQSRVNFKTCFFFFASFRHKLFHGSHGGRGDRRQNL